MTELYEGAFLTVFVDEHGTIWIRRGADEVSPDLAVEELRRARDALVGTLISRRRLVFDLTRAPGRNDPEFEAKMRPAFAALATEFEATAVLMSSEIGRLQLKRLTEGRGFDWRVVDRSGALAFAAGA